jgi:hypothetical protein
MPFKSKSQMRLCFNKHNKKWNCEEWLDKTEDVCCLPEKVGEKSKFRCIKKGERIIGKVQTGPRGGKYFTITEKDSKGKDRCTVKVYLKK